jgi:hypothetical protein
MAHTDELPQHFFRALCQDTGCRAVLGGFHIPCVGGMVAFCCPKCAKSSVFRNEAYQIRGVLAPQLVLDRHAAPQAAEGGRRPMR